ncbi:MAG: PilN domain-containing protein [Deltaproteobacteria bacterium]|nr:PilN domain-containing protein [Deltaproteobacteria bacterium]
MIRINLLPQKREVRRDSGQGWLVAVMLVTAVEVIGLVLYHQVKLGELNKQKAVNSELESQASQIESTVKNHEQVKKQLEGLRAREEAITKLQTARSGPTAVLLELARLLTEGRGPTVDPDRLAQLSKDNPLAVFNAGWDVRRLWINAFTEHDRVVKIDGYARDGEDVSELARRLNLSNYYYEVKLLPSVREVDAKTKVDLMKFQLQAKVRY